ncbi:MAG TPA: tyrosine-type recombinase/integrase [Candidatus Aquilonibacter sp.]|nr:tyrosine-type recombinase/integrase [Candidatus Aquilonibacter sp.]
MKTAKSDPKTSKAWRVEKIGNATVPIYRRKKHHKPSGKRYQVFEVADYSTGQRRLQSYSDAAKAISEAQRIGRLLATGETAAARLRGSEAASYGRAVELIRDAGLDTPLELVAARYVEAVKILGTDKIVEAAQDYIRRNPAERPARTVREVADELIALKSHRKASARYVEDLKMRLAKLAERFSVRVDTVTTADVQAWLDEFKAAPRTIRNFRNNASALFKFAEARGYIARGENPVTATEKIKAKTADAIEIYTPGELARLLAAAPDSFKPVLAIQAFAGLRSAEVMRLDWQNVKLERGHIEITAANAKTASRRIVPILPNLAAWLKDAAQKSGKIFPHTRAYFHEMQREISAKTKTEKLDAVAWKHNALRHSFISYRVADVQNVAQVALEAGNSPAMIFGHYRELVTADDAKTWFAIAPKQPANIVRLPSRVTMPKVQFN